MKVHRKHLQEGMPVILTRNAHKGKIGIVSEVFTDESWCYTIKGDGRAEYADDGKEYVELALLEKSSV